MPLSQEHIGSKIVAKIYILTRAELLFTLCYEIPCITNLFQLELAHWFYSDEYVPDKSTDVQKCDMQEFFKQMYRHVPFLRPHSGDEEFAQTYANWKQYKLAVPTYGKYQARISFYKTGVNLSPVLANRLQKYPSKAKFLSKKMGGGGTSNMAGVICLPWSK